MSFQAFGSFVGLRSSFVGLASSGWPDLNRRPPRPKRGALAKLRYSPS
jgi:hypothetical protein